MSKDDGPDGRGVAQSMLQISGGKEMKFARALAASQKSTRDQAMTALRTWLEKRGDSMGDLEMAKLWKGLFYCLWMADKQKVQQELIQQLVSLADLTGDAYLRHLFRTVVREWQGIDRHRIDKFYALLSAAMAKGAELEPLENFLVILDDEVFQPATASNCSPIAKGVALHVLDRFDETIVHRLVTTKSSIVEGLALVFKISNATDKALRDRARRAVLCRILARWKEMSAKEDVEITSLPSKQDAGAFLSTMRQLAADKAAPEGARAEMYDIYKEARAVHAAVKFRRGGGVGEPEPLADLEPLPAVKVQPEKRERTKKKRFRKGPGADEDEVSEAKSTRKSPVTFDAGEDPYNSKEAPMLIEDPDTTIDVVKTPSPKKSRISSLREAAKIANQQFLSPSRPSIEERLNGLKVANWASKTEPRPRKDGEGKKKLGRVRFSLDNNCEFEIEPRKERLYASQFLF